MGSLANPVRHHCVAHVSLVIADLVVAVLGLGLLDGTLSQIIARLHQSPMFIPFMVRVLVLLLIENANMSSLVTLITVRNVISVLVHVLPMGVIGLAVSLLLVLFSQMHRRIPLSVI